MTMKDRQGLFGMLDGEFAEGSEILDFMQMAFNAPEADLTEREKCRLFMGRLFFAAAVEAANRAAETFAVAPKELMTDLWVMAGQAVGCVTVQAFDSAPHARRVVRKHVKECVMMGFDHIIQCIDRYDGRSGE